MSEYYHVSTDFLLGLTTESDPRKDWIEPVDPSVLPALHETPVYVPEKGWAFVDAVEKCLRFADGTMADLPLMTGQGKDPGGSGEEQDTGSRFRGQDFQEIRQKYGDEEADRANACVLALTQEEYTAWKALGDEILQALTAAVQAGAAPAGPEGQRIAQLHRRWLSYSWEAYTPQAHAGLAELYVSDPRFTAYYDREVSGCAAFLRDAVRAYTGA